MGLQPTVIVTSTARVRSGSGVVALPDRADSGGHRHRASIDPHGGHRQSPVPKRGLLPESVVAPTCTSWRQHGARVGDMPSVQIKSVPADVHAELRRRAANEGKSLQEYLLGRLVEEARRPSLDEVLDRAGQRSGGHVSFRFASDAVREDRDAG